jgi:DNA helicase-2/ATP-dependent DNA helicase PcrA
MDLFDQLLDNQAEKAGSYTAQVSQPGTPSKPVARAAVDPARLLAGLNPEQARAVQHVNGPLLILAGAGSGKTRVITHRIAWLVEVQKVSPSAILAITFTNKAAAEMKTRVEELVGSVSSAMWIGTFHSMLARILRRYRRSPGLRTQFCHHRFGRPAEGCQAMPGGASSWMRKPLPCALSMARSVRRKTPCRHRQISPREAGSVITAPARLPRSTAVPGQAEAVQQHGLWMSILLEAVHLMESQPDVLAEYQKRFRYILVDEYQDTTMPSTKLVQMLRPDTATSVWSADDDQSIYAFAVPTSEHPRF